MSGGAVGLRRGCGGAGPSHWPLAFPMLEAG